MTRPRRNSAQREDVAGGLAQPLFEDARHLLAIERVVEFRIERIDVDRQLAFLPQVIENVFERRHDEGIVHLQAAGQMLRGKAARRRIKRTSLFSSAISLGFSQTATPSFRQ